MNASKCKVISNSPRNLYINNSRVEKVDKFTFLGSIVPGSADDIPRRITLANSAFGRLKEKVWSQNINMDLKVRLYKSLILPIAIYASETWTIREKEKQKLLTFERRCFRSIKGVILLDRIRNTKIRLDLKMEKTIVDVIKERRLKFFGHINRRPLDSVIYQAYSGNFNGKRPPGRPPARWTDMIKADTGLPLATAERQTMDRGEWRNRNRERARGIYA